MGNENKNPHASWQSTPIVNHRLIESCFMIDFGIIRISQDDLVILLDTNGVNEPTCSRNNEMSRVLMTAVSFGFSYDSGLILQALRPGIRFCAVLC